MRVVLDTNVIIAAFAARGLCSDIFELCLESHSIIISEHILSEVEKNLIRKVRLPESIAHDIIEYLRGVAEILEPSHANKNICRAEDDVKIIGTALSGNAGFIITGDDDLLVLKKYGKIKIVTPREFWSHLRGK